MTTTAPTPPAPIESLDRLRATYASRTEWIAGTPWETIDTRGPGEPVFLLPGGQGTGEVFFKPLLRLGARRRLVAVHYPAQPDGEVLAAQFAQLLDAWQLPRASLAGSSLGAYWAQLFAHRHPERVSQLVLGNTFVDATDVRGMPAFNEAEIQKLDDEATKQQKLDKMAAAPEGELKQVLLDQLRKQSAASIKSRSLGVARSVAVPVLALPPERICVLDCEDDAVITPLMKRQVAERYAASEQVCLPFGGHYPHILNPDAYVSLLARRLSIG